MFTYCKHAATLRYGDSKHGLDGAPEIVLSLIFNASNVARVFGRSRCLLELPIYVMLPWRKGTKARNSTVSP